MFSDSEYRQLQLRTLSTSPCAPRYPNAEAEERTKRRHQTSRLLLDAVTLPPIGLSSSKMLELSKLVTHVQLDGSSFRFDTAIAEGLHGGAGKNRTVAQLALADLHRCLHGHSGWLQLHMARCLAHFLTSYRWEARAPRPHRVANTPQVRDSRRLVLGSWAGARRPFHLSLFRTAPRMVLPQDLSTHAHRGSAW